MYSFFALETTELVSHRAEFFDFFYMRINKIRHICGLGPMHLYGRGCKPLNLLKPPCLSVHSSVHSVSKLSFWALRLPVALRNFLQEAKGPRSSIYLSIPSCLLAKKPLHKATGIQRAQKFNLLKHPFLPSCQEALAQGHRKPRGPEVQFTSTSFLAFLPRGPCTRPQEAKGPKNSIYLSTPSCLLAKNLHKTTGSQRAQKLNLLKHPFLPSCQEFAQDHRKPKGPKVQFVQISLLAFLPRSPGKRSEGAKGSKSSIYLNIPSCLLAKKPLHKI